MTQAERLHYYFEHMFNPESVVRAAGGAGIAQALDLPWEWKEGAEGYGKRFASSYAQHAVQSTVMYGISAMLHEDNRYFLSGETTTGARMKYAIASTFLARHNDGSRHVSYSRVISCLAAAAISRVWQPRSSRGPFYAAGNFAAGISADTAFNIAREFFPKILHTRPPLATAQYAAH